MENNFQNQNLNNINPVESVEQEPQLPKKKSPVFKIVLYVLLAIVLLGGMFYAGMYFSGNLDTEESPETESFQRQDAVDLVEQESNVPLEMTRDRDNKSELFAQYQENLYPNLDQDHILTGARITSIVEGYLEILEGPTSEVYDLGDTVSKVPYLAITDFSDIALEEALIKAVQEGNSINRIIDNEVFFNLGCYDSSELEIVGEKHTEEDYMNQETHEAILNSNSANPILLELTFGDLPETSCICCNLAHTIRVVE